MSGPVATRYFGSNRQNHYRSAIALFFRSTTTQQPWWFSVLEEVVGHADSPLYKLFGLSFDLYTRICLKAGLISQRMHQGRTIFTPNISEWDVMITEYNLNSHLNSINATKIDGKRYYFINIGSRKKQFHSPKDQFNGRVEPPSMLRRSRRLLRDVLEEEARWQSTACEDLMEEEEEEAEEIEAPEIINYLRNGSRKWSCSVKINCNQ